MTLTPKPCPHHNTYHGIENIYEYCLDCGAVRHRHDKLWHSCHLCILPGYAVPPTPPHHPTPEEAQHAPHRAPQPARHR